MRIPGVATGQYMRCAGRQLDPWGPRGTSSSCRVEEDPSSSGAVRTLHGDTGTYPQLAWGERRCSMARHRHLADRRHQSAGINLRGRGCQESTRRPMGVSTRLQLWTTTTFRRESALIHTRRFKVPAPRHKASGRSSKNHWARELDRAAYHSSVESEGGIARI